MINFAREVNSKTRLKAPASQSNAIGFIANPTDLEI